MKAAFSLLFSLSCISFISAECHHKEVDLDKEIVFEWEQVTAVPFNQVVVSWNGARPQKGAWDISVSLMQNGTWQPRTPYMHWAAEDQKSHDVKAQDTIDTTNATAVRVTIEAIGETNLENLSAVHIYTREVDRVPLDSTFQGKTIEIAVPATSQIALQDPISERICSPTSTYSVVKFFKKLEAGRSPLTFAAHSYDSAADIYGNWVLNTAHASHLLGEEFRVWVERRVSFQRILDQLSKGMPTVVSIKGPLPGSARPYENGHLLVVRGYNAEQKRVLVMDPAFPTDQETYASYALDDFLTAWGRRDNTAYLFEIKE